MDSIKAKVQNVLHSKDHKETGATASGHGKTVLVTGGSGFVAAEVLNAFLSRGYNVRATVRNDNSAEKVKKSHAKYITQLSFSIVPDIQTPGAFDEAVIGVDGVIHTASPFQLQVEDNERDLLNPAVKGTTEILKAIKKFNPTVKRVVITSSFASIINMGKGEASGYTYTEKDWNPVTWEEAAAKDTSGSVSYCASKTFAEKAAFDFVKEEKPNFDISTICPPMIYGPAAHTLSDLDHLNTSSADIYRLMNGSTKEVPPTSFYAYTDVRDVGEAHARAYESPIAAGQRYFITGGGFTYHMICEIIRKEFPEKAALTPEPTKEGIEKLAQVYKVDNSKAKKELEMTFRSLEETILDQVTEFIRLEKQTGK